MTVPELVAFRLTRSLVDGLGPTGTEGTFARAAEATAVVLRDNSNALLTILSAIAADPLYRWSVSPGAYGTTKTWYQTHELQPIIDSDLVAIHFISVTRNWC